MAPPRKPKGSDRANGTPEADRVPGADGTPGDRGVSGARGVRGALGTPGTRADPDLDPGLDPRVLDPDHELLDTSGMRARDIEQSVLVLDAVRGLREADQRSSQRARSRMGLNETDMRALRFLVIAKNRGQTVTPGALAAHLGIATASTTKLLDRLSAAGHVERLPHASDRRALAIRITTGTHERVRDSVGRLHARRFEVVARLTPAQRALIVRFLHDLSEASEELDEDGNVPPAGGRR